MTMTIMKKEKKQEKPKKDYTNLLLGITGVVLLGSHLAVYCMGYMTSWNICNNQMLMKEAEYVRRGLITQEQIQEVWDACFGVNKGS